MRARVRAHPHTHTEGTSKPQLCRKELNCFLMTCTAYGFYLHCGEEEVFVTLKPFHKHHWQNYQVKIYELCMRDEIKKYI